MRYKSLIIAAWLLLIPFSAAFAQDAINTGDTAWIIVSTALVMFMTPAGLALFYGGMSRSKNLLNTYAMTLVSYCLGSVVWVLWDTAWRSARTSGASWGASTTCSWPESACPTLKARYPRSCSPFSR